MRPLKHRHAPLADIEQADHAQHVLRLYGDEPRNNSEHAMLPGGREGEHRSDKNSRGLDTVATHFDGNCKSIGRALNDAAEYVNMPINRHNQTRADARQRLGPWYDKRILHGCRQFRREQRNQNDNEQSEKAQRARIFFCVVVRRWMPTRRLDLLFAQRLESDERQHYSKHEHCPFG